MSGIGGSTEWEAIGLKTADVQGDRQRPKCLFCDNFSLVQEGETEEYLEDKPRSSRPSALDQASKIVSANSLTEKRQSTRKLAKRLSSNHGHQSSHRTVQRYLLKNVVACAYRRTKIPKLTEEHVENLLKVCQDRSYWTKDDWSRIIFSGESLNPSEILRIMSSGLQRKEMLSQFRNKKSPTIQQFQTLI